MTLVHVDHRSFDVPTGDEFMHIPSCDAGEFAQPLYEALLSLVKLPGLPELAESCGASPELANAIVAIREVERVMRHMFERDLEDAQDEDEREIVYERYGFEYQGAPFREMPRVL